MISEDLGADCSTGAASTRLKLAFSAVNEGARADLSWVPESMFECTNALGKAGGGHTRCGAC